jgi:hypothetical protein
MLNYSDSVVFTRHADRPAWLTVHDRTSRAVTGHRNRDGQREG